MGLFRQRGDRAAQTPQSGDNHGRPLGTDQLVWLPGHTEVQVAGETFHEEAIMTAYDSVLEDGHQVSVLRTVLVPQPGNRHDPLAIAVYTAGQHVGFLPRPVAQRVQPTLLAFSQAGEVRRLVSCPAEIDFSRGEPQVVLLLDPAPLGLPPEAFETVPEMAATITRQLHSLDEPAPLMTGTDQQARSALALAEERRAEVDGNYDRGPGDWPQVEWSFREVAAQLTRARDPMASEAWLGASRSIRYQKGRRDDTLAAIVGALYFRRDNAEAWSDLIDMASAAPHVPTLLAIFSRVPAEARDCVLAQLVTMSHGHDRLGWLRPTGGERLRQGLLELAESQGDMPTVATLTGLAGLAAEKAGNIDSAVGLWRRAVAANSTDGKVADRFSIWLVKQHQHEEAARVLRQALTAQPDSAEIAERMRRRLTRCEQSISG